MMAVSNRDTCFKLAEPVSDVPASQWQVCEVRVQIHLPAVILHHNIALHSTSNLQLRAR